MERNREARRATMAASVNGLSRRRHRSSSLRDSPEEDGPVEMHEPGRLRDRGVKKDRDRDRDRERDRSNRSKRRRGDRLIHGSNRDDVGEESSEESVNDEEDEDDDEGGGGSAVNSGAAVRILPPNSAAVASISSSLTNHHQQQQHRKSFLPTGAAKVFRPVGSGWKPADEMIGFSVPRKARSASTKRSHEYWMSGGGGSGGGGVEQIHQQASTSPVRPTPTPSPAAAPISPSSSNVSVRKKIKPNGPKLRPPKSSSKSSSNPEELEIEIAEVLYGLKTHSQGPSKKENDSNNNNNNNNNNNKSSSDAKSRVSSPISNSTSTAPQSSVFPQNSSSSASPLSAVAPKRKRPRQVSDNLSSFSLKNSPISSTTTATMKVEIDQSTKTEISGQNPEKNTGSVTENGGVSHDFASSVQPETPLPESGTGESKPVIEESRESRDLAKEEVVVTTSPKKESSAVRPEDDDHEDSKVTKVNLTNPDIESRREEKFEIDLRAPPPQLRSSPEREAGEMNFVAATEQKPVVSEAHAQMRTTTSKDKEEKGVKSESGGGDEAVNAVVEPELKKAKATDAETDKPVVVVNSSNSSKERNNIDLQLDLEKSETVSSNNKLPSHTHKQPKASRDEPPPHTEKTAQSSSLPLPMSMASWPGGLPSMGYMAPLQGVVSMDGSPVVPSTPLPPLFSQPRPKRCATHCYIARNIHYLQQLMKMNPFWSAAAGSASLFGAKPCNLNVVPSTELHGNIAGRSVNTVVQEKGPGLSIFPGHSGKDKGSQAANITDAQRKQQILIQQALAPGAPPNNILHGPAFIFPLNQQQAAAAAAASVRPGTAKSPTTGGGVASTSASNSTSMNGSATAAPTAAALGFNYPNVPGSDTPYLAILQGNAYPFQIPAVGAPPTYRGTHAQAMPYFNGSFYSSQMIHPSQLQQQQQQQPSTQQQQVQQGHQNTSISSGSSSSQKHLQSQQQRQQGSSTNGGNGNGNGNLQSFSASKNRSSQASQQQQPNQHLPTSYQNRQLESEAGGEDSPSNADSRVSRPPMSLYGPNFAMPFQHQNFALMTPPSALAGANGGGNQGEKKQQQQPQQQGSKPGAESLPPQTFAMSFASMPPGIDISSMAQNHAVLQSLPEVNRHNFQIMAAAAQAAHPKKNFRVSEEGKTGGGDSSSVDEEKKGSAGKIPVSVGQSIVFSRPDLTDAPVSTIPGSTVIDSSARTLNLVSAPSRSSRSSMPNAIGTVNSPTNSQMQAQLQYQQQHILLQKHHQQQQQQQMQQQLASTAAARNKTPATSNGSVYSDHLNTSSSAAAAKYSTVLSSAFPQNLVQSSSSSPAQSPQWKNSARTTSQIPSSLASSTTSSLKSLPQQQARTQQSHTQISFGASQKSTQPPQGQQAPNSHQSQSPPMVVGSPSTSSISKGAGGSPRMSNSTSQGNKAAQPSTLSSQQSKNSASVPSRKSSPVGSRNVPSILGNPHITSSSTGTKSQMQQQQLPKHTVQQPQLFFTSAYMQAQAPHSTGASSTASTTSGYYIQRRRPEQQQQSQQQQQNSFAATSSTGMLSLCPPVTLASASTSDAKAVAAAAATSTMKGGSGSLTPQSIPHPVQFAGQSSGNSHHLVPPGFSIVHAVPAAVVKPVEQKQPAGNRGCLTRK